MVWSFFGPGAARAPKVGGLFSSVYQIYYIGLRFIVRVIYIILNLNSYIHICRTNGFLSNNFSSKLYGTLVFL